MAMSCVGTPLMGGSRTLPLPSGEDARMGLVGIGFSLLPVVIGKVSLLRQERKIRNLRCNHLCGERAYQEGCLSGMKLSSETYLSKSVDYALPLVVTIFLGCAYYHDYVMLPRAAKKAAEDALKKKQELAQAN